MLQLFENKGKILKTEAFVYTGCENLEAMAEAKNYNNYLIKFIESNLDKGNKILDFGAGSGTYADLLKEKGTVPDCLEPDKTLQGILKNKGYNVVSTINDLKPKSYDIIYALNVFEHIEDDHTEFAKIKKYLKPGGKVIIYVPAFQALFSSMDERVGHFRRYNKSRLKGMAKDNGMDIIKLHYCDPVGFAATTAFKASRNKSGVISAKSVKLYDTLAFPVSKALEPILKHGFGKNVILIAQNNG